MPAAAFDKKNLKKAINAFKSAKILVVGDIIVDHFIWGSVTRISPEAPVPVVNVTHENLMLGGSANVLHNIYAQGAQATLCGVIGNDAMGDHLLGLLADLASPTAGIVRSDNRPTILKTRIVAQHQQVVRFDREKTGELSRARLNELFCFLDEHLHAFDAVIVSDYSKGMISNALMDHIRKLLAKSPDLPLIVDPKPRNPERFKGVSIITPNQHEAELMSGMAIESDQDIETAAKKMQKMLGCKAVLITRGESGMALYEKGKPLYTIPTVAKEVYDVTGAGDTVAATLALGLAVGLGFAEAAMVANFAAGIVVGKIGTATASTDELLRAIA